MRNAEKYPGVTEFTRAVGTLAMSGLIAGCPSTWIIEIICVFPCSGTVGRCSRSDARQSPQLRHQLLEKGALLSGP
jgi:hypothetical protein